MKTLEIHEMHELKERINELLRSLKEGETIKVTDDGEVIAELVPERKGKPASKKPASQEDIRAFWKKIDQLAAEIGAASPGKVDAVDVIRDVRRDL